MRVKRQNRIHNLKGAISYPITKDASAFASIKKIALASLLEVARW